MLTGSARKELLAAGLLGAAVMTWWPGLDGLRPALGAQPAHEKAGAPKGFLYYGAESCARCHTQPLPTDKPDYVLLTEYKTWVDKDKHSMAHKALELPTSKQMGTLLNIDVMTDARCLNCHSANVPNELRQETFKLTDGVSCDACHGPSEKWFGEHTQPKWRKKPVREKEELGMIDVRDPVKRSNLCLSCHVGNASQGKVVTHAMYAAGHPPLSGIEIATFSEEMPRHWRYIKDKPTQIQKEVYEEVLRIDPKEPERTKLAVVGSLVAFRAAVDLLAGQAAAGAGEKNPEKGWPELAQFDCYACHHELKTPSWRQERGYLGPAGRPQMRSWPKAMIKLGILYAGKDQANELSSQFHSRLDQLHKAFNSPPFGKAGDIVPAARELVRWMDQLSGQLNKRTYRQGEALELLQVLCELAREDIPDYDTARQISWTFRIIYGELDRKPANDQQIQEIFKTLDKELKLALPSGTGKQILAELEDSLQKLNDYRPKRFQEIFGKMSELLAQAKE
jgi:hypothetical protein